jgi:hypothetical protein
MATMSHYSRVLKVVIDAPPDLHDQELAFWQGAARSARRRCEPGG